MTSDDHYPALRARLRGTESLSSCLTAAIPCVWPGSLPVWIAIRFANILVNDVLPGLYYITDNEQPPQFFLTLQKGI
jgi:hypothetical protein